MVQEANSLETREVRLDDAGADDGCCLLEWGVRFCGLTGPEEKTFVVFKNEESPARPVVV
jgi:hypothetical protein